MVMYHLVPDSFLCHFRAEDVAQNLHQEGLRKMLAWQHCKGNTSNYILERKSTLQFCF